MASQRVSNLPVVDFTKENLKPNTNSWNQARAIVRHALEEYGCFVALYDQVSPELGKEVFDSLKDLFDLPMEIKAQGRHDTVGYYVGNRPDAPLHESTGIPDATTFESVQNFTNLMWPSGNKRFRDAILSYTNSIAELEKTVDRMVFESYGAERHFEQHIETTTYLLRPLKYDTPQKDTTFAKVGTSVHTDKGSLTVIHQNQVNALEVQTRNGEWISVDFPLNSFVVMAGDAYEIWSNGRIYPPKHRAIMRGDKPRYCLVLFSFNSGIVEVPEELVDKDHPLQFKPFDHFGLLKYHLARNGDKTGSASKAYCGIAVQN